MIVRRQLLLLKHLLERDAPVEWPLFVSEVREHYDSRKNPVASMVRDVKTLAALGAIRIWLETKNARDSILIYVNLDWPSTTTDTEFFEKLRTLPKSKSYSLLVAG